MDLVEQVHIVGVSNIHTYGSNISLVMLFLSNFQLCKTPNIKKKSGIMVTKPVYRHLFVFVTKRIFNNDSPHETVDNLNLKILKNNSLNVSNIGLSTHNYNITP